MTQHWAYYNEIDPVAAKWLRNLIDAGHIAPGFVDERSIEDVLPADLRGFTQCHFFAGIGVWSLALRRAAWPDSLPVWTGSCPCQPFSASGAGAGFDDERHLWPSFAWLIEQCHPPIVLGEQVASKTADPWVDLVHPDVEAMGYAFGAVPFPSAGVGAPHLRDRLYWVAHADNQREESPTFRARSTDAGWGGAAFGGLGYTDHPRLQGHAGNDGSAGWQGSSRSATPTGVLGGMDDTHGGDTRAEREQPGRQHRQQPQDGRGGEVGQFDRRGSIPDTRPAGPVNGHWRDADWIFCRDGKWRPVEPDTFPLADGVTGRVGRLRAYGNAINLEAAVAFISAIDHPRGGRYVRYAGQHHTR